MRNSPAGAHTITGVSTSETAFVDFFAAGPLNEATRIQSFAEFEGVFGGLDTRSESSYGIQQYFLNGGRVAWVVRVAGAHEPQTSEWIATEGAESILGRGGEQYGIYALSNTGFNVLCLPDCALLSAASLKSVYEEAARFCNEQRAFMIADIPPSIDTPDKVVGWLSGSAITRDQNAAVYFPRVKITDKLTGNPRNIGASGTMAGIYARTDEQRGVWKAAVGLEATLAGVDLATTITDTQNGVLNPLAINALRHFPAAGNVCWGARTLVGADQLVSEWKYIPVRRTALFLERSIYEGTNWAHFEPNDVRLWEQIRTSVEAFMQVLFRSGAFQGSTPKEAYFVKCGLEVTSPSDIDNGVLNIQVGFAPIKPAEFVVIKLQQLAAQVRE
ncbi:MAG: phage tail sheath C-terminal domain-containing protein [Acidobacteriota bacterium]